MLRLWDKGEERKLIVNKRKRRSIRINVYLYEVCISYIIYCLLFNFKAILIPFFFHHISGIYLTRGKEFINYWPQGFELEEDKSTDEFCRAELLFYGFNTACKNIAASFLNVGDDSMSAIRFQTTAKGNLPHLSYIFRNMD